MDDDSIEALVQLISAIRTARTEVRVPAGAQMEATVTGATPAIQTWFRAQEPLLKRMARLSSITFADSPPPQSLHLPFRSSVVCLPVAGVIDMAAELARLDKELQKTVAEITSLRTRLTDDTIRKGAPAEVLEEWQERLATLEEKQGSLQTARALLAV
jgi:valyl-tRNA synthetase